MTDARTDSASPSYDRQAFGLTLRSCVPLPGMSARPGGEPDVEITYGPVAAELPGAVVREARYQAAPDEVLLTIDGIGRFLITGGRRVVIDRYLQATDDEIRLFLLGSAFGALLHQRHDLVLHGSAIDVGGAAVGFLGASGSGKSTLATAFSQRRYRVLTDDLCVIRPDGRGVPWIQPGVPQMKLWLDALERLHIAAEPLPRVRQAFEKRAVPVDTVFSNGPLPVRKLYVLKATNRDDITLAALEGAQKFIALKNGTYRLGFLEGLGGKAFHFHQAISVARQTPVTVVARPSGPYKLAELVDRLTADFAV